MEFSHLVLPIKPYTIPPHPSNWSHQRQRSQAETNSNSNNINYETYEKKNCLQRKQKAPVTDNTRHLPPPSDRALSLLKAVPFPCPQPGHEVLRNNLLAMPFASHCKIHPVLDTTKTYELSQGTLHLNEINWNGTRKMNFYCF